MPTQRDPEQTFAQKWFDGVHCNVGGGYEAAGLSDIVLLWMAEHAKSCGLDLDLDVLDPRVHPDARHDPENSQTLMYRALAVLKKVNALTLGVGFSPQEIDDLRTNVDWYGNYLRTGEDESVGRSAEADGARGPRPAA